MIVFDLRCRQRHVFEAWFGSSDEYRDQQARGLVSCPVCGCGKVEKALMAPSVGAKGNRVPESPSARVAREALAAFRAEIERTTDDVGDRLPEEARARHALGADAPARGLRGLASQAEARALLEEGIPVLPLLLPPRRRLDA